MSAEIAAAPAVLTRFKRALNLSMVAIIAMIAVFFLQQHVGDIRAFAIVPQASWGWWGAFSAPLLHGSLGHLAANAFSVLVLGALTGTVFPQATRRALPLIWLGSGLGTWLIASDGFHIGASGVTHGLGFLIFTLALLRRDRPAIAAAMIAFFLFGGMLLTVLPQELGVSWQYHLSGAVVGLICGIVWCRADPPPARRIYSWEIEPETTSEDDASVLELPRPNEVPVLWHRATDPSSVVLKFRRPDNSS